jgi:hypothetical protein
LGILTVVVTRYILYPRFAMNPARKGKGQKRGLGNFDPSTFSKTPDFVPATLPIEHQPTFMTSTVSKAGKSYNVLLVIFFVFVVFIVLILFYDLWW